jgi:hypothetical protein
MNCIVLSGNGIYNVKYEMGVREKKLNYVQRHGPMSKPIYLYDAVYIRPTLVFAGHLS